MNIWVSLSLIKKPREGRITQQIHVLDVLSINLCSRMRDCDNFNRQNFHIPPAIFIVSLSALMQLKKMEWASDQS